MSDRQPSTSDFDEARPADGPVWSGLLRLLEVALYGLFGGYLATLANLPASWLTGALVAVTVAVLAGRSAVMPNRLRDIAMLQIGLVMGAGFTPDMLAALSTWPVSILILAVTVVAMSWGSYAILRRVGGWDHASALFGAMPGALSYVMVLAEETDADMPRIAIAQTLRVFVLIAMLPLILAPFANGPDAAPAGPAQEAIEVAPANATLDVFSLGLLIVTALAIAWIFKRLKMPAGILLAGMLASGSLYLSGVMQAPVPQWFAISGFVLIGMNVGLRFSGIAPMAILRASIVALLALLVSSVIAFIAALFCAWLLALPLGQVFLAFAPGGFETMVLLAFLFELNPAYVAGHHLVRYMGLVLFAPFFIARLLANTNDP